MSIDMNMSIMVVDDSGFMRKIFISNLKEIGFSNISEAEDGMDAINKLQEKKDGIDLIISDWNMPNKDGLDFLRWVRRDDTYKETPFIMATAQGDKASEQSAIDEGANAHIAKPFTSQQLKEKVNEALGIEQEESDTKQERKYTDGKVHIKIAHIQITDHLILGVLNNQIKSGAVKPKYFELETECIPGWNPIQKSLEKGEIDGAFVLAPIAMDLYAYNVPIKLVLFAHKNGSIFVRSKNIPFEENGSIEDVFYNRVVNIPHKMSIHNMLAHKYLSELGLTPGVPGHGDINVRFEVIPPIQMPQVMKDNKEVAGFIVAEPIGSNAIAKGIAEKQFLSTSLWKDHPCCVLALRDDFIKAHTDAVYELTSLLVDAGKLVAQNKDKAAEIAVDFLDPEKKLGLTKEILLNVLNDPLGITTNDLFPVLEDLETMQKYMYDKMGVMSKLIDIEKFVDTKFAYNACKT